jgi:hypothetical protein
MDERSRLDESEIGVISSSKAFSLDIDMGLLSQS